MLGWELPPFNSGGLGEACLGLSKSLAHRGTKIIFLLPRRLNLNFDFMTLAFADIGEELYLNSHPYKLEPLESEKILKELNVDIPPDFISGALSFADKAEKISKKYHFDIIHAHDWMTSLAGIRIKETTKKPLVMHIHSTELDRTGGNSPNRVVFEIERNAVKKADKIISVSEFTKKTLIDKYEAEPEKIRVVYNGIFQPRIPRVEKALTAFKELGYKIILFLGRITLQKGPEYFVRCAKKVIEYYPKSIFVVAGTGDMQGKMIQEAANLGILEKFIFTGFVRGEERDKIYQSADIFVMPSVSEPFGIAALESIANGTPTLISKQSGVSEILQSTLKSDFWDIDEMANKIISYLKYTPLRKVLKREGSFEILNYTWDRQAEKCENVYKEVLTKI